MLFRSVNYKINEFLQPPVVLGNGGLGYASQKYIFLKLYFKNTDLFKRVFNVILMIFCHTLYLSA